MSRTRCGARVAGAGALFLLVGCGSAGGTSAGAAHDAAVEARPDTLPDSESAGGGSGKDAGHGGTTGSGDSGPGDAAMDGSTPASDASPASGSDGAREDGSVPCPAPAVRCERLDLAPPSARFDRPTRTVTIELGARFAVPTPGLSSVSFRDCATSIPISVGDVAVTGRLLSVAFPSVLWPVTTADFCIALGFTSTDTCGTVSSFDVSLVYGVSAGAARFECRGSRDASTD